MSDTAARFDVVHDLCATVLAEARYEPVMTRVLAAPRGSWTDVMIELKRAGLATPTLAPLHGALYAAWLDEPSTTADAGFVLVVFAMPVELWSTLAHYNRGRLVAK